jgi:dGTP triphosphohydrolase
MPVKALMKKDPSTGSDSTKTMMSPDSALINNNNGANSTETEDPAKETTRQIMANLLSSKKEISELKYDVGDSLSNPGLSLEKRLFFSQTIQQLEESPRFVNKQIEQIVVSDLQERRGKLSEIVQKMKGSGKELGRIIARPGKITNYMQAATNLIQPLVPVPAAKSHSKEDK